MQSCETLVGLSLAQILAKLASRTKGFGAEFALKSSQDFINSQPKFY